MNRQAKHFRLHKTSFLTNVRRINRNYLRQRNKRITTSERRASSRSASVSTKLEPKNVPWLPEDDYLLINSVLMTCNLSEVYHTVRFSHYFTEKEIEARWRALLFDPLVSQTSLTAISRLSPIIKAQMDRQVPFSSLEDSFLVHVKLSDVFADGIPRAMLLEDLHTSVFAKLLKEHPSVFYTGRDEFDLFRQWSRFQTCGMIDPGPRNLVENAEPCSDVPQGKFDTSGVHPSKDDNLVTVPLGGDPENFSDVELLLQETVSCALATGLDTASAAARRQRMLEQSSYHGFQAFVTESLLSFSSDQECGPLGLNNPTESTRQPHDSPVTSAQASTIMRTTSAHNVASFQRNSTPSHSKERPQGNSRLPSNSKTEPKRSHVPNFDAQKRLELCRRRRRLWARIRRLSEEAKRWTALVEIRAAKGLELTDSQPIFPALAALTGNRTRFLIKEKDVTFGRSSFVYRPHIDLSLEGDAARVSRCHGRIHLTPNGKFWLANFSPHPVFVDGNPVLTDEEVELCDSATVLVAHLAFRFDVNQLYVSSLRDQTFEDSDTAVPVDPSVHDQDLAQELPSPSTVSSKQSG